MKFWEAMREMQINGTKVRSRSWPRGNFIYMISEDDEVKDQDNEDGTIYGDEPQEIWEIYEEPKKSYSWMEVVAGLKEDKTFSRPKWESNFLLISYDDEFVRLQDCMNGEQMDLTFEDFEATDWIEVKE